MVDTPVRRVLLDETTATGVEFVKDSETFNVSADKEVILSAGAIHSPKLLQVSGIGPESLLEAAGIETVVDLPGVGQNFQDHSSFGAVIERTYSSTAFATHEKCMLTTIIGDE